MEIKLDHRNRRHKIIRIIIRVPGSKKVGKTAIIEQLIHGHHIIGSDLHPTIEDIYDVLIENDQGIKEKVRILDTAGLETSNSDLSKYASIADGFVLVYSVTSMNSLDIVQNIKKEIDKKGKEVCPMIVLGTKTDMLEERECDYKSALKWAENEKAKLYEICVGDRHALKESLTWLVSKMSSPTGKGYKGVKPDKTFLNMRKTGSHKTLPKDTTT
ncbi:NF-kappa-B inhibitor-interacting Ras-like protein 1 [Xenia sp. Carnegie-2017]|uniref:NF-kappa-B inhibitor-interacting Ras-like protein 1 n=1 Tax=Xenia sp. Carnegie-2017 TaxID=2897299 RepID=UPI001F038CD3|nr:NF-kappa-B inhibitor-interacting Ras-like protein 1 [Xenia sp. Carnegie-2017]